MFSRNSRITFTAHEVMLLIAVAKNVDPNSYIEDDVKAAIYKAKAMQVGDTVSIVP